MKILPKIDIHVHAVPSVLIYRQDGTHFPTPDEIREMYGMIGVDRGVLLPDGPFEHGSEDICSNREAMQMVRDYPDVFGWWFCEVSPFAGENTAETNLSHYIRQYQAHGAKGVGEVEENRYFDDPYMFNLFRHCEACGAPVLFHIGEMGGDYGIVDELHLPHLERALAAFPNLKFIGHSQKFWAEIGQCDSFSNSFRPEGKVIEGRLPYLFRKYPNLYGDLSAGSGRNAMLRDPEYSYRFLEEFQDRLFFGTDLCTEYDGDDLLFPGLTVATLNSWANTFSRMLGVDFYWHALRHTWTTELARKGVPDDVIQAIQGWDSNMVPVYKDIDTIDELGKYFTEDGIRGRSDTTLTEL